jgi:ribosome biogenesis GTPase
MAKKKKVRVDFRKNRGVRTRQADLTRQFATGDDETEDARLRGERISGKGELTRRRTVMADAASGESGSQVLLEVDEGACLAGRVLAVRGLTSTVQAADGTLYECATRRLLKTLATDQRHVVCAGDRVLFRPAPGGRHDGVIERVQPRHGVLSRASKGRQQILVTNVDQILIVTSAAEPPLKPNLIDRLLITAEQSRIQPVICINKIDLVEPASLAPLVGVYSQMGYRVLLLSATSGFGIERLRRTMHGCENAVVGQSGVGKSSLLNAVEAGLHLRIGAVSVESRKGRHTTTTAELLPLSGGGYVVDTPGVRQFQLWDVVPQEIAGYFRDLRPFVSRCHFPDCTHTHEEDCAVKNAVADDLINERRYESYCRLFQGDWE